MSGRCALGLLLSLLPVVAAADAFPSLIEFSHPLPGWSWVADPPAVEVGYVRPYDLSGLHGSHLRFAPCLGERLWVGASLEVLRAGVVDHRRPGLDLRARWAGQRLGVHWARETVEVEHHASTRRSRLDAYLRWSTGSLRVAGRWELRPRTRSGGEPATRLVLAWVDPRWELALRRRPSPWRRGGVWDGGVRVRLGGPAALGVRLREEDAALHLDWWEGRRRLRFAFTLDGPRARGLALALEWGR